MQIDGNLYDIISILPYIYRIQSQELFENICVSDSIKATSSAFDQARSNFTSCDEHVRSSLMNSLAANGLQREMPRYISKSTRLTRPAPAPPALMGVKLKPPIPAPRRFPSLTRENRQVSRTQILPKYGFYGMYPAMVMSIHENYLM